MHSPAYTYSHMQTLFHGVLTELGQPIVKLKDPIRHSVYHPMFSAGG